MINTTDIFRSALKRYLEDQNIKQSEIADSMGIARPTFNAFLRGKKSFSLKRQEQIANHIGYDYIDFINSCREHNCKDLVSTSPCNHSNPEHEALIDESVLGNDMEQTVVLDMAERRLLKMYNALDQKHKQLIMNMITDIFISFYHSD